jgi:hypothetical protein
MRRSLDIVEVEHDAYDDEQRMHCVDESRASCLLCQIRMNRFHLLEPFVFSKKCLFQRDRTWEQIEDIAKGG